MVNKKQDRIAIPKTRFFFGTHMIFVLFFMLDPEYCYGASNVAIGVVLDMNSTLGNMADLCMRMAISDFYAANRNYKTRLQLKTKNSGSVLDAQFAVVELLEQEQVQAIIGPQGSKEAVTLIAEIGAKVDVPIISFTARTSATANRYFVRTTQDDEFQAQALADICKKFEWPSVVVLYEDTDYNNQFVLLLNKAFQDVEIGLAYMAAIPTSAKDGNILKELRELKRKQTRVFLVHMNPSLGYRLLGLAAKEMGMMSEGFAWIITDSISNFMHSIDSVTRDPMEGVVGIRPYVSPSRNLENFRERWKRNMIVKKNTNAGQIMELNIYGLWAYDAVTALAIAVEKIGSPSPLNSTSHTNKKYPDKFGTRLVNELSRTKFRGLSGEFELVDGRLKHSEFEIFNVIGSGERRLGFWTPGRKMEGLKQVFWPGDSVKTPIGWSIPESGKLRVGIPWKHGFTEFVKVTIDDDPAGENHKNVSGISVDIFLAALKFLPFPIRHVFIPYGDGNNDTPNYDDMLKDIPRKFDMVVGDTTIWAPRAEYVDFSLPYSESGAVLVVRNEKPFDMWIFIKPLNWDLWLAIVVACLLMGVVLFVLERRATKHKKDSAIRGQKKKRAPKTIYWSSVAVLAFPDSNMVSNNWSVFVLVFWLFMAYILAQSYTANLSAILTTDQLKFVGHGQVGYQEGSYLKEFLIENFNISPLRLKNYSCAEDFHNAMSKGSKHGGIDAIFDEIPYMKLLLNTYPSQYKMVGPMYKTGGFGFAFPYGSPLAVYFSRAILNVTQGPMMTSIERKNFGLEYSSKNPASSTISQGTSSLTFLDFAGLFIIVGSVTIFALFCSETPIGRKLTDVTRNFIVHFHSHDKTSRIHSKEGDGFEGGSTHSGGEESHEHVENTVSSPPPAEGSNSEVTGDARQQGEEDTVAMDQRGIALSPRAVQELDKEL